MTAHAEIPILQILQNHLLISPYPFFRFLLIKDIYLIAKFYENVTQEKMAERSRLPTAMLNFFLVFLILFSLYN